MALVDDAMLLIQTLDPRASIQRSQYTGKWYVSAKIDTSDGVVASGGTKHMDTPALAVTAYLEKLKAVGLFEKEAIGASPNYTDRRFYRWNGAGFVEVSRSTVGG